MQPAETFRRAIPTGWQLPPAIERRLGAKAGRQRAMAADGHLLIILHAVPEAGQIERASRMFWRNPAGEWRDSEGRSGGAAASDHLAQYETILNQLEQAEEAATTAEDYFEVMERLAPVVRAARHQYEALQEARTLSDDDPSVISLRDDAYALSRQAELLYQETQNSQQLAAARRTEEQTALAQEMAVASHRLNVMAALFLPLATLTAVFGTNLTHGLETAYAPGPFLIHVGAGLAAGILLAVSIQSRPRRRRGAS